MVIGRLVFLVPCSFLLPSFAFAQALSCVAQPAAGVSVRAEGIYEPPADLLIQCSNGLPAAGIRFTSVDVSTVPETMPLTSRTLDSVNAITEAFLLIGEPSPAAQIVCQAPQTPSGCTGANVFPGIRVSSSKIRFTIPFTDPGPGGSRVLRIVNLRAAVSQLNVAAGASQDVRVLIAGTDAGAPSPSIALPVSATVTAAVAQRSVQGSAPSGVPSYACGDVNKELAASNAAPSTTDGRFITVRVTESSFPSAFRKRNSAPSPPFTTEPGTPVAQDTPGVVYQTETGFYAPSYPGNYAFAGLPAWGSRIFVRVHNVPGGVKLFAPTVLLVQTRVSNTLTTTGAARRLVTNADGANAYSKATATSPIGGNGGLVIMENLGAYHQAIYEIVETDPTALEEISVPIYPALLASTGASGGLTASVGWAPLSSDLTGELNITPRFQNFATPFAALTLEGCQSLTISPQSVSTPASGASGTVSVTAGTSVTWTAVPSEGWIVITSGASGTGNGTVGYTISANATGVARSATIAIGTATFTVNQEASAGPPVQLNPTQQHWTAAGTNAGVFTVTASGAWSATSFVDWVVINSVVGNEVRYSVAANASISGRTGTITVNSTVFTVIQDGTGLSLGSNLLFVPITPCRIADTRENLGSFGKPALVSGVERSFVIPSSPCSIPTTARAYALNVTVVPKGPLSYITMWPTGVPQPFVSTLNSADGRVKANAAIVPAGSAGAVSVMATDATELVLDISGYFIESTGLAFYPLTPCRVLDTRNPTGSLGGPILASGVPRSFPVRSSVCGVPASAQAYSLNATVVPSGGLGYLTLWPTGQNQPFVSTLNSPKGSIVANAAIVPAGLNGEVSAFVTNDSHLVVDINGYFAPPGSFGALRFNAIAPCRVGDTRNPVGSLGGPVLAGGEIRNWAVTQSPCGVPGTALAYSMNATVVPTGGLGYLSMWPAGQPQPFVSTLNAAEDAIVANALLLPAGAAGAVSSFATNQTHLVLDINGYFAQ